MITVSMVSTPLHLFMAANIACSQPNDEHHLIFIDQKKNLAGIYLKAVKNWRLSPFLTVEAFYSSSKNPFKKLKHRRLLFSNLKKIIKSIKPDEIRVGNDRRIEFQYAMHVAHDLNSQVKGAYLDEGTFTYIGRESSKSISDRYIDNFIKKVVYGFWWDNPMTVGASKWIEAIYVAFPDMVFRELESKEKHLVSPEIFSGKAIKQLSELLCLSEKFDADNIANLDVILFLPHESLFKNNEAKLVWLELIESLSSENYEIGVKYHPRDGLSDALGVRSLDKVTLIPQKINFESLVFLINKSVLIGDVSSVLLLSRWLRPELNVVSIGDDTAALTDFLELYSQLKIPVLESTEILYFVKGKLEKMT